jgi:hypothetical protein
MKKLALILLSLLFAWSCTDSSTSGLNEDDFAREAILVNWADNIIIPAFEDFAAKTSALKSATEQFSNNPTQQTLAELRQEWVESYTAWQRVSMFEMGKAMELRYRDNLNIYPTDTDEILENIREGTYNLELPSLNNSQGFPALDFLLYGLDESDQELLSYYTTHENADSYKGYVTDVATRIDTLTGTVLEEWQNGYRDEFVSNSGNGANSSLDMMVNDYIFYYEKILRAGKIGIPAGVFSGTALDGHIEGFYSKVYSKSLFLESLRASQNFFNGRNFGSQATGESLSSYLEFLNTTKDGSALSGLINSQFEEARLRAEGLESNLSDQVKKNNTKMLSAYDALQRNVVFMKVDMLQALNINVDYVDADGD